MGVSATLIPHLVNTRDPQLAKLLGIEKIEVFSRKEIKQLTVRLMMPLDKLVPSAVYHRNQGVVQRKEYTLSLVTAQRHPAGNEEVHHGPRLALPNPSCDIKG